MSFVKKIISIMTVFLVVLLMTPVVNVSAKTTLVSGNTTLFGTYSSEEGPEKRTYTFEVSKNTIPLFVCDKGKVAYDWDSKYSVKLYDEHDEFIDSETMKIDDDEPAEDEWIWFCANELTPGAYKLVLENTGKYDIKMKFHLYGYSCETVSVKTVKSLKVVSAEEKSFKITPVQTDSFPIVEKITAPKGLVGDWWQNSNNTVTIVGGKTGKGTATLKLSSGKTYKIKLNVKAGEPWFEANLTDHNTRNKYFKVWIKNYGYNNLTVIRSGKVIDDDYKSYDRKLKKQSSVVIKPGKSKTIKFSYKGRVTWYDSDDFTLYAKVKYQGKTYSIRTWYDGSAYKVGKKWYASS